MAENVVINVVADTRELNSLIDLLEKLGQIDKKTADAFRAANVEYEKRTALLQKEKQAVRDVSIESEKAAKNVKDNSAKIGGSISDLTKTFNSLARTIGLAFGVAEVIRFGTESVKAFQEAEKNALLLNKALSVNGGTQAQFDALIKQSSQLEGISIFSDDDIQQAQTAALQYGLTADVVEQLTPLIADLASAQGIDLQTALRAVISGTEGSEKALREYGIQVDSTASKADNLRSIQAQLEAQYKGQAELIGNTSAGAVAKLGNAFDNLQEKIGEFLATKAGLTDFFTDLANLFTDESTLQLNFDTSQASFAKKAALDELGKLQQELEKKGEDASKATGILIKQAAERAKGFYIDAIYAGSEDERKRLMQLGNFQNAIVRTLQTGAASSVSAIKDYASLTTDQLTELAKKNDQLAQDEIDRRKAANKKLEEEEAKHAERIKGIRAKIGEILAQATIDGIRDETERQRAELLQQFNELSDFLNEAITIDPANAEQARQAIEQLTSNLDQALSDLPKIDKLQIIDQSVQSIGDNLRLVPSVPVPTDEDVQKWQYLIEQTEQIKENLKFDVVLTGVDGTVDALVANLDQQREAIEEFRDEQLAAIEEEEQALLDSYERREIGKRELEQQNKQLALDRVAAEKKAESELNAIKRKQDIANRAQKIFEIGIATARNAVEQPGIAGALIPFWIGLGAIQAAAVLAQPLPKYKKGTLSVKGVGSEDSELALLQPGEAVIPTETNRKYHPAIKAIYKGTIKPEVINEFVNLKLKGGNHTKETTRESIDLYALARIIRKNNNVTISNWGDLAKFIQSENPRRV